MAGFFILSAVHTHVHHASSGIYVTVKDHLSHCSITMSSLIFNGFQLEEQFGLYNQLRNALQNYVTFAY